VTGARVPVVVRPAREADLPRLVALLAAGSRTGGEDVARLAPYRVAFHEISATPGSEILVAEVDGDVLGLCQLFVYRHLQNQGGRCAEIESMHVDERHRSRGIGGELLEAAVRRAAEAGCYRVQLTSHNSRLAAHRFYERHGFEASHRGFKRYLR
jgi:GNAT superfamily N-acetyltransferase